MISEADFFFFFFIHFTNLSKIKVKEENLRLNAIKW